MAKQDMVVIFKFHLKDRASDSSINGIYYHLFNCMNDAELEVFLDYWCDVFLGKDEFQGVEGANQWFYLFHKSIRQGDFFECCFRKETISLLSDQERKELIFLRGKVREPGYNKRDPEDQNFNKEYKRYLFLCQRLERETVDKPINGSLDMLLWHTIHLDLSNVLKDLLEDVFTVFKDKKI